MKKHRFSQDSSTIFKITTNAERPLLWRKWFSASLQVVEKARALRLARQAKEAGILPLLVDVIRIERRLQRGTWQFGDDGRLWVFID